MDENRRVGTPHSFRDLLVWQRGIDLVAEIYRCCKSFPKTEVYGLGSQMQRAAVSIPANLAEGSHRDSTREFLHYISIALGSLAELETHLTVAVRIQYLSQEDAQAIFQSIDEIGKMTRALQKSLRAKL
jgi:four helix bundle protein